MAHLRGKRAAFRLGVVEPDNIEVSPHGPLPYDEGVWMGRLVGAAG